jgi:hypothetical protein
VPMLRQAESPPVVLRGDPARVTMMCRGSSAPHRPQRVSDRLVTLGEGFAER